MKGAPAGCTPAAARRRKSSGKAPSTADLDGAGDLAAQAEVGLSGPL